MRRAEPNWLIKTWEPGWPLMFWKSRAGPPEDARRILPALAHAVGDLGDFEDWIYFGADFLQFAGAVERGDPVSQVVVGQSSSG